MDRLCKDVGSSWSWFVWLKVTAIIPWDLIGGACSIRECDLAGLTPFYAAMLCSYVFVNNLCYEANPVLLLPQNIWFTKLFPFIDRKWYLVSVNSILDIPLDGAGKVDLTALSSLLDQKPCQIYFQSCQLQKCFAKKFRFALQGGHQVHEAMLLQHKMLLQMSHSQMLSLSNWCWHL